MVARRQHPLLDQLRNKPLLLAMKKEERQKRRRARRQVRFELKEKRKLLRHRKTQEIRRRMGQQLHNIRHRIPEEAKRYYLNVRIKGDLLTKLEEEASLQEITIPKLVRQILQKHFQKNVDPPVAD